MVGKAGMADGDTGMKEKIGGWALRGRKIIVPIDWVGCACFQSITSQSSIKTLNVRSARIRTWSLE